MNSPIDPKPGTSTVARDPTTPGTKGPPTALGQATITAVTGTPVAIVTVWLLETYGTAHGQPLKLDSTTATAIGSVGAAALGYLWQVLSGLLEVLQERLTRPPPK